MAGFAMRQPPRVEESMTYLFDPADLPRAPVPLSRKAGEEIIIDSFAGGGGASEGIFRALGRHPDVAINHDPMALAIHMANHPATAHYCKSVYAVDPREVSYDRPVGLLWTSPDCRHHSRAKGAALIDRGIRDLAWVVIHYAELVRPRVICLENVSGFRSWTDIIPKLDEDGRPMVRDGRPVLVPDPAKIDSDGMGDTFKAWLRRLRRLGYRVEWRELAAKDFGAPTLRTRLYLIARCDKQPIVWPKPTHGPGRPLPWRTTAECLDFSLPCHSIFLTRADARSQGLAIQRPLQEATMARIAQGVRRYVLDAAEPFLVTANHSGAGFRGQGLDESFKTITASRDAHGLVVPRYEAAAAFLSRFHGRSIGSTLDAPAPTSETRGTDALVCAWLAQHNTGLVGHTLRDPLSTIIAKGCTQALVTSHLVKLRGTCRDGQDLFEPMPTITAGGTHVGEVRTFLERHLGTADGMVQDGWVLADIGMRMLEPRELARAQGFYDSYVLDPLVPDRTGRPAPLSKSAQTRAIGNSVCPDVAAAIVAANLPELAVDRAAA